MTVDVTTQDGTATAPTDYDALATDLLFAPGDTSKTVDVTVHGDTAKEGNETFTLQLSGATNASVSDATGIATILDDDDVPSHEPSSPIASISDVSIEEGHAGETATATFDVRLSHPAVGDLALGYRSVAGTATDGHDYLGVEGIVTLPAGSVGSQVDVTVLGDNRFETDETFIVEITSVASLAPVHRKQLLTYLRLADKRLGLLINFHVVLIKDGISRIVNRLEEDDSHAKALRRQEDPA